MHRREPSPSFLRSKVLLAVGCMVIVFVVVAIAQEVQRRRAVAGEIRTMEEEIARLEQQRYRLTDLLQSAGTPEFLEREARLRLGLQKPGEAVLIVPGDAAGTLPSGTAQLPEAAPPSNPQKWWRQIFR